MCVMLFFLILCACDISPILSSAVIGRVNGCSIDEFECSDGFCVKSLARCDGVYDCLDGGDEQGCGIESHADNGLFDITTLHRSRRQTKPRCSKLQWQCRDGSCISFDEQCDGLKNCPDGSDETYPLCRKMQCQSNWFRCKYGACVDGTAPCNGVKECADESDELLPRCRNETGGVPGKFKCEDGTFIDSLSQCDGIANCPDRSDETVRACAAVHCPDHLFQCAYGACADQGADCNGKPECADGSDESDELCNRMGSVVVSTETGITPVSVTPLPSTGACVLPANPEHGSYAVTNMPNAVPGQRFPSFQLTVSCHRGYRVFGDNKVVCYNGDWNSEIPKCQRFCKLNTHPSVHYNCVVTGAVEGQRACESVEPEGTHVKPKCNAPNYYSAFSLPSMRCIDGTWDNIVTCTPDCGKVTPAGEVLVIGGRQAKKGELPWHAGIYWKTRNPYEQICGGSLVSNTVVISAAHCFWTDLNRNKLPDSNYAVAVGKLFRSWDDKNDTDAQKSDVQKIHLPKRYQGVVTNYQDDIAIVVVTTAFKYETFVRPVCLNFDVNFQKRQLQNGKMGKMNESEEKKKNVKAVAGWGLTSENGVGSPVLKVVKLPYVEVDQCYQLIPENFKSYITSDKICAGFINNRTALCKGDSGGGLSFPEEEHGIERYYLRGLVSAAPNNNQDLCNAQTITAFTQIMTHEHFIKQYL